MLRGSYDVVIVGAGVAGCAAALSLPPGTRALIVDRAGPESERCCGGLLAPDAQAALAALGLGLPDDLRVRPEPRFVHVHDLDNRRHQTYRRDYLNLDRPRFDAWLLALAAERVEVSNQTRFVGAGSGPGEVRLSQGARTAMVETRLLVGADGASSTVRRHFFPDRPGPPTMVARQVTLARPERSRAGLETHEVLFASALTDFYAWAIPKGETVLIGCAFEETEGARARFEQILAWYREQLGLSGKILGRSARRLSRPRKRAELFPGRAGVLLIGEAAGLVSPSSGEGISYALLSGLASAQAIATDSPETAYRRAFVHLERRVAAKTLKAKVIYSPRLRSLALRLPWYP